MKRAGCRGWGVGAGCQDYKYTKLVIMICRHDRGVIGNYSVYYSHREYREYRVLLPYHTRKLWEQETDSRGLSIVVGIQYTLILDILYSMIYIAYSILYTAHSI